MLHLSSPAGGRARRTSGTVLLVLLVSIAPLGAATPPWAVESPAAAGDGARFGLGLEYLFEHQESLRFASQQSVISLRTEDGGIRPMVVDGDPGLLNRKFDLEWELNGPGVRVPLALSCFRLTDLIRVFPTLILEAASVDVTLDSISKTEANPKTSLQGRGSLFGAQIGVTASLCGACPWFNGTSYHYRNVPNFDVDRSPGFVEPGFEVLRDEVRLSQEVHQVSTKFGYVAPGGRVAYYTGIRGRWTEVDIEDELRLSGANRQETSLSSRTKLDSTIVEAIAGVDIYLGGSIFARTETAFSSQDYGARLSVVYVGPYKPEINSAGQKETREEVEMRAEELAGAIVPSLRQILAAFMEARASLPIEIGATGMEVYPEGAVISLLASTERDLFQALGGRELTAMRDYIQRLFSDARASLGVPSDPQVTQISFSHPPVKIASLSMYALLQAAQPASASLNKVDTDSWLDRIGQAIGTILDFSDNDELLVDLCVKSTPKNRAEFRMRPISYEPPVPIQVNTNGPLVMVWRGLYKYSLSRRGFKPIQSELDLVRNSESILNCQMISNSEDEDVLACDVRAGDTEKECP